MSHRTEKAAETFHVTFEPRDQYIYVLVEGETQDYRVMKQYWQDIAQKSSEYHSKLILLENNIPDPVSIFDMFQTMSELRAMGFSRSRVAFVDQYPGHREINEFAATVASNRGVKMRTFSCVRDAEEWLMAG